jgi:hypothetical protein
MARQKKKTHEQDLARVRKNQRNHRARVKEYVVELEKRLEASQMSLEKAESRILELSNELEKTLVGRERATSPDSSAVGTTPSKPPTSPVSDIVHHRSIPIVDDESLVCDQGLDKQCPFESQPSTTALDDYTLIVPPTKCCTTTPTTPKQQTLTYSNTLPFIEAQNYTLPSPRHCESTTPCESAYILIDQQNYRGLDIVAIYEWLKQGFRSGFTRDDGCRVENGSLFALLDYVSGG